MGGIFSKAAVQTGMNLPKYLLEVWQEVQVRASKARYLVLLTRHSLATLTQTCFG